MRTLFAAAAALSMTMMAPVASAANYTGDYFATRFADETNKHAVWIADGAGLFDDPHWIFVNNSGRLSYDGTGGSISGTIESEGGTSAFDIMINFSYISDWNLPAKCEMGAYCETQSYKDKEALYDFLRFESGTFTGKDGLDGLVLTLSERPADGTFPGQVGIGGSAKPQNKEDLSFSTWFTWTVTQNTNGVYVGPTEGRGDVNVRLAPVPIPAAGLLLLSGLGGTMLLRARRRQSA
ncbi:MAG: hypothetical protein AAGJ91_08115 [Pseudomonadota bacterium]